MHMHEDEEHTRGPAPLLRPGRTANRAVAVAVLAAALAAAVPANAGARAVTVYAASSLSDAFPALTGSATYNFAASNTLQAQIERGAPADVFASASPKEAQALYAEGRCARPVTFATNTLVLLVPASNPGHVRSVYTLRAGGRRISIGNAGVPVGAYTRRLLARLHLSSILTRNTVSQESNVSQVTSKVALGSADAGFVYRTDARAAGRRVRALTLPRYAQPPVRYQLCAVKRRGANTTAAQAFIRRVVSTAGRRTLQRFGFGLPPRG
jgi:molybdate transport system substrate-binding protein